MNSIIKLIVLALITTACVKEMEVIRYDNLPQNGISIVLLNSSNHEGLLRKALTSRGFSIPAFASVNTITNKSQNQDVTYNQAEARYGIKHYGILSANNPCFTNGNSWQYTEYTFDVIDLTTNQSIMTISKGGRTSSCPGSLVDIMQTTDLFGDLADELKANLK